MDKISVLKFGGTSVKSIGRIEHVAGLVANAPGKKKIVVVSAMGDTTDYLCNLAKQCSATPDPRELDLLLSTGEQVSITLLAMTLQAAGIRCRSYTGPQIGIRTNNAHGDARIVEVDGERLRRALDVDDVVIVAGFQGLSDEGELTTLGRGGSDTTAVALAVAANASECQIYTDVDGVFTSDPNKIENTRMLPTITYGDVVQLAHCGAQVIHPRAVELAQHYGVEIIVRNTFNPENPGTVIKGAIDMENYRRACAVAVDDKQACITLKGIAPQYSILRLLQRIQGNRYIEVGSISQHCESDGKRNVYLAVKYKDADQVRILLDKLKQAQVASCIEAAFDVSKVSLIGTGLRDHPELAHNLLDRLECQKIQPQLVSSLESRISFLVANSDVQRAAQIVHDCVVDTTHTDVETAAPLSLTA